MDEAKAVQKQITIDIESVVGNQGSKAKLSCKDALVIKWTRILSSLKYPALRLLSLFVHVTCVGMYLRKV